MHRFWRAWIVSLRHARWPRSAQRLGVHFLIELISAVAGMPQRKIDDALDQLANAELIFRRGVPPDAEYTFKHALVQDAAYSTLLRSRRQQLHARIATALESSFPEIVAAEPAILAHHCAEAGLGQKAVTYRLKAGQQAVARSAMAEAVAQLENGLRLLTTMPLTPERQLQELDLRIALGPALIATTGYSSPKVGEVFAQATVLAEEIDRPEYLVPLLYTGSGRTIWSGPSTGWRYHLPNAWNRSVTHGTMQRNYCKVAFTTELFAFFLASCLPPERCSSGATACVNQRFGEPYPS